ncbi:MAG: 6-bladed beta-propeller, partial [Promethearchaeota archaeon]
ALPFNGPAPGLGVFGGAPSLRSSASDWHSFLFSWGSYGSSDGQFDTPYGVAVNSSGAVYVVDSMNNRVQVFDQAGNFLFKWGGGGTGDGQFSTPHAIALNSSGAVYVTDVGNQRVQVFDQAGNFLFKWGSPGTENGQFSGPEGIAVNSSGAVYVLDQRNNRTQVFDQAGAFLFKFGSGGTGDGQFMMAVGIAVNGSGHLFVVDEVRANVQVFDQAGNFLFKWGSPGSEDGSFDSLTAVAVNSTGQVYTADSFGEVLRSRVQIFSQTGEFLGKFGSWGNSPGDTNLVYGIAFNGTGHVFLTDEQQSRVNVFSPPPDPPVAPALDPIVPNPSTNGTVHLTWTPAPPSQVYTYDVYRSTSAIDEGNVGSLTPVAKRVMTNEYTDWVGSGTWWYAVMANNGSGQSLSNSEDVVVSIPPVAPVMLAIEPNWTVNGSVGLNWTQPPQGQTYTYDLYRELTPITSDNVSLFTPLVTGLANYSFLDNVTTNGTYYYAVVAKNSSGSTLSNNVSVLVAFPPDLPENVGRLLDGAQWYQVLFVGLRVAALETVVVSRKRRGRGHSRVNG